MPEAVIVDCLRTPVGKAPRGALRNSRPDDLAAIVIRSLLEKYPAVKDLVDDVILGCERLPRRGDRAAAIAQLLERRRTADFVHEVAIDLQQTDAVAERGDHVIVEQAVEERHRGHGEAQDRQAGATRIERSCAI